MNDVGGIADDGPDDDYASISSVGLWVVRPSHATNLVFPDTNDLGDVFARGPYGP